MKRLLLRCCGLSFVAIALSITPVQAADQVDRVDSEIETPSNLETPKILNKAEFAQKEVRSVQSSDLLPEVLTQPKQIAQTDSSIAQSVSQPEQSDRWQFSVEPYFFVPLNVKADITAAGRGASIRAGLGSILNLDRAFDIGARLEARKNKFGVTLDAFYLSAGQSGNLGVTFPAGSLQSLGIPTAARVSADGNVSLRQGTIDLAAFYRVVDTPLNRSASVYPRLVVEPTVGLRTNIFRQKLEVDTIRIANIPIPFNREFSVSRTTVEPLIGARIGVDLSYRWTVGVRGDVSGFNLNADRDITWNLLVGARYRLSPKTSLQLAYSLSNFLFEEEGRLTRARLNLRQEGLWLSALFEF
ncbi:MAG: hypothetical protein KME42_16595 [Tildeniella nuda ZEHNDER 1965/U140]|nr:hypothetical protein [Tildeniella nuda ZEHNDER 1965/U140]